nr:hypothetical protein [Deltaproteobacteria bacterium]
MKVRYLRRAFFAGFAGRTVRVPPEADCQSASSLFSVGPRGQAVWRRTLRTCVARPEKSRTKGSTGSAVTSTSAAQPPSVAV